MRFAVPRLCIVIVEKGEESELAESVSKCCCLLLFSCYTFTQLIRVAIVIQPLFLSSFCTMLPGDASRVRFSCPYHGCSAAQLSEHELRQHVHTAHATSPLMTQCPICTVNNGTASQLFVQPSFSEHLQSVHGDRHDSSSHLMICIPKHIPHHFKSLFAPQPPLPCSSGTDHDEYNMTCDSCGTTELDITGWYLCYQCAAPESCTLCQSCHSLGYTHHRHHPAHMFLRIRRRLSRAALQQHRGAPLLYPISMLGSHGYNLQTEFFFLTLHCLHVGMLRTVHRYTALVNNLQGESDSNKLDSLMKVKYCVDAQLLHPAMLKHVALFYVFTAQWCLNLLDHERQGAPLSQHIPVEFAGLPEYVIEDMADCVLFLCQFSRDTVAQVNFRPIVHLFILLLSAPAYMNNPYLRGKVVEVLVRMIGQPPAAAFNDAFCVEYLIPALLRLYVDIEHTATDSAYSIQVSHSCWHFCGFCSVPCAIIC